MKKLLRTLWKNKVSTLINLIGLSTAFSIAFLILIYVKHEGNYDSFHKNSEKIFRVNTLANLDGNVSQIGKSSYPVGPMLFDAYPEITDFLRLVNAQERTVTNETDIYSESGICYADTNLLSFFDFPLLAGSDRNFDNPNTMLINKEMAVKYFGSPEDAVGKTLEVGQELNMIIAVIDMPSQTHVPFDFFISTSTHSETWVTQHNQDYLWIVSFTYVMLSDGSTPDVVEEKFSSFYERVMIPWTTENDLGSIEYALQPLTDIYVNNSLLFDFAGNIDARQLTIFTYLAFAILLIASINYMNLFTAQVSKRMVEVGIKKAFGASNARLIGRFTMETLIVAFSAFLVALLVMYVLFPGFNSLLELDLESSMVLQTSIGWMLGLVVVLGIISGIYPALYVSGFGALAMMTKNDASKSGRIFSKTALRKVLVTFQLAVSSALMITIFVVSIQLDFIFNKDLGFNQEAVYVVDIPNDLALAARLDVIKQTLKNNVNVLGVAASSALPGQITSRLTFNVDQQDSPEIIAFNNIQIDSDFLELLGIDMAEGRNFRKGSETDPRGSFLVNEALAKRLAWDKPLEKRLGGAGIEGRVAGVIKNFNHASLHNPIEPLVMFFNESSRGYQLIKVNTSNLKETLAYIEESWKIFAPEHPYEGFFLDESYNSQYNKEAKLKSMFIYIGALAIVITALGLIGMTLFTIERKLKEISIRRVIGASTQNVMKLLTREYLPVILIANLIAIPLTVYALNLWLSSFAFQAEISTLLYVSVFVLNGALVLMIILPMVMNVLRRNLLSALRIE